MSVHDEYSAWRHDVIDRLARVEAGLVPRDEIIAMRATFEAFQKFLGGNGAPGLCQLRGQEIENLREKIEDLHSKQSWMIGIGFGVSAVISAAITLLSRLLRK